MPPRPSEGRSQREIALLLRYAIDNAIAYPTERNINSAIALASQYPQALRSSHVRHNLGDQRWRWLNEYGVYPVGEPVEISGSPAIKGTIEPEIKKS